MTKELINYHKTKMRLAEAEGRTEDYKFHKAAIEALSKPELPSNLDEAANDSWALYEYRESPEGLYSTCYVDGFEAGAEWMAGQGVVLNLSIDELSCGAYNACVKQGLTSEDDVIIQIRKK